MVETTDAFEAKLRGQVRETGDGDMIIENILRPGKVARLGCDYELGFEHLLVVVVARTQHHAVHAERDRLLIGVGCDVLSGENWHCCPTMIQVPPTCNFNSCSTNRQFLRQKQRVPLDIVTIFHVREHR